MKIAIVLLSAILKAYIVNSANVQHNIENKQLRIANGYIGEPGQFPYQALVFVTRQDRITVCGGCLITDQWILTAGHCVSNANKFEVHLGAHKFNDSTDGRYVLETNKSILHSGYNGLLVLNDIGLIKLPVSIKFNTRIKPASLPSVADSFEGEEVIASGWGRTSSNDDQYANELNWIPMNVITNNDCSTVFPIQVRSTVMCAQGTCDARQNCRNVCGGDSGGPLALSKTNIVIGITSFGARNGCDSYGPSGFTRVTSYISWINAYTGMKPPPKESGKKNKNLELEFVLS